MKYDYLIVGAGLYGTTFAYRAKMAGKKCLVIDKRPHLGGNLYCEKIEGINVHKYGAHIFHTSNKTIWDFVNSFVEFNHFKNSPLAYHNGKIYNLPFNMNTFYQLWGSISPAEASSIIQSQITEAKKEIGERPPKNLKEQALLLVGKDIFNILIKEYTEKQWGRSCDDLPPFIINRLPIRFSYDNNYFCDKYQGIPIGGYNVLINAMLKDIDYFTNTDFFSQQNISSNNLDLRKANNIEWREIADNLVYTGAIDEYFNYSLGRLEWRSIMFRTRIVDTSNYQGNAVVNYTSHEFPYTRIIEHKHFEKFGPELYDNSKSVISEEYSLEKSGQQEPFYPINNFKNNSLAAQYRELAKKEKNVIFGGRLGQYRYYDMAPIIEHVFNIDIK